MTTKTILIADDDSALLHAMSARLENEGYEVFTTQDGYQALALTRREHPDLLILDINMPAGSGISVLQRILSNEEIEAPAVIFMTGQAVPPTVADDACMANTKMLHKPFESGTLLATVRECLGNAHDAPQHA